MIGIPVLSRHAQLLEQVRRDLDVPIAADAVVAPSVAIRTDDELADFVTSRFGIAIPRIKVCPDHDAPFDAFAAAFFARARVVIIHASRLFGGKTTLLAALASCEAAALGADVTLLGGSGAQSSRVHKAMTTMWRWPGAPRDLLCSEPGARLTRFSAGNEIEALLASQRSVHGPHPNRLRLDECDDMSWEIYEAASGQVVSRGGVPGQTTIASTRYRARGTMDRVLGLAATSGTRVYRWCWRETMQPHGWMEPGEVAFKRLEMGEDRWRIEVEHGNPNPADQPFGSSVATLFDRARGKYNGAIGELVVIEPYAAAGQYAHGFDWGRKKHFSAGATWRVDTRPFRLVAAQVRHKEEWPAMIAGYNAQIGMYGGGRAIASGRSHVCHDAGGVGDVVRSYLSVPVEDVFMVGQTRVDLFVEYLAAAQRKEIVGPYLTQWASEHAATSRNDLEGDGHPPDTVVAQAMAYRAAKVVTRQISVGMPIAVGDNAAWS